MRVNSLEFNQSIVNSLKRAQRAVSAANPRLNEIRLLGGLGHRPPLPRNMAYII